MFSELVKNMLDWQKNLTGNCSFSIDYKDGKVNVDYVDNDVDDVKGVIDKASSILTYTDAIKKITGYKSAVVKMRFNKAEEKLDFVYDENIKEYIGNDKDFNVWHFDPETRIMGIDKKDEKEETPNIEHKTEEKEPEDLCAGKQAEPENLAGMAAPEDVNESGPRENDKCNGCPCTEDCRQCEDDGVCRHGMPVTDDVDERVLSTENTDYASLMKQSFDDCNIDCESCRDHIGCKSDFCVKELLSFMNNNPVDFHDIVSPVRSAGKIIGLCFPVPFYKSFIEEPQWLRDAIQNTLRKHLVQKKGFADFFIDENMCYMMF